MQNIPNISFDSADKSTDFELLNLSGLFKRLHTIDDHNPYQPHRISFFALLIVTQGNGKHQIDLKDYSIQEGTVLKIAKGQVHAFQTNPTYEGFLIIFTENFVFNYFSKSSINIISHLYNYHLSSPIANYKSGNDEFITQIRNEINSELSYAQHNIIAAYLNLYLLKLERSTHKNQLESTQTKSYETFLKFKNLLESNFTKTRNVKDYADLMSVSTKLLNQVSQEFTIKTAKNFIDDYVILEVKREITSTTKSFKEISYNIGFDEVTNFTKYFKKNTNKTPKEFRNKQTFRG